MRNKIHLICLAWLATAACTVVQAQDAVTEPAPESAAEPAATQKEPLPLNELRIFTEVFAKIKRDYVEEVDDRELLEDAIRGMLAGLDPHSSYLDEDAYQGLQEGTTGEFGGLGIEVGTEDGFIKVITPIDDTPAARAGIQAGDLIIRLDDTPVKGLSLEEAIERMRGKAGTEITLSIIREGVDGPLDITLVRDKIKIRSVRSRMLEPGFGYIRVSNFQAPTGNDFRRHLKDLMAEGELQGLIVDLRNNPGGVLGAAVSISDSFLSDGLIVYTGGRAKDAELEFKAKPPDMLQGAPLIVLVNEGSASASEIVAGALQDRGRAVIMGRKTFGKGSVQTILPMNNESALKLTTARYYTPSGRSIQADGVTPDIVVDKLQLADRDSRADRAVRESHLAGHLENPADEETGPRTGETTGQTGSTSVEEITPNLARADFELYEALNLLKGMALLQARAR